MYPSFVLDVLILLYDSQHFVFFAWFWYLFNSFIIKSYWNFIYLGMVDSEKVVDLQSQVNALKNETLKLKEHLSKARQATNQYKEIADASEKQVVDSNEIYKQMKGKYEELQASTNATQKSLKDQIGKLESSKAELEEKATAGK